jgi:hypothetical protein
MPQFLPITFTRPRTHNPQGVLFELFEPGPGPICPITQDPICTSQLDFLQDRSFDETRPMETGARLACKHEFTAMCLLYHWARNGNVTCPMCRHGPSEGRLNLRKLPDHFRLEMCRRIRSERHADREEHIAENLEAARQFDYGHWFVEYQHENTCCCMLLGRDGCGIRVRMAGVMENNVCIFTGECDAALLRTKRELKMLGALLNAFHCQTPFPDSDWTDVACDGATGVPTENTYNMTSHGSSFQYILSIQAKRAKLTVVMPMFLFQFFADQHEQAFAAYDWQ